jgi:hypothetical protein
VANWFEANPVRSIVVYTIIVAGSVWAAFVFIFDENKIAVYRAQVENEKATANQYRAKTEALESEIANLRLETQKYREWLVNTPNTIPYLEQRIRALTEENTRLRARGAEFPKIDPSGSPTTRITPYSSSKVLNIGEAFTDPRTNATLGVSQIASDFTANVVVNIPGEKAFNLKSARPGETWSFNKDDRRYQLTISKIDWFTNKAEVQVRELDGTVKPKP